MFREGGLGDGGVCGERALESEGMCVSVCIQGNQWTVPCIFKALGDQRVPPPPVPSYSPVTRLRVKATP